MNSGDLVLASCKNNWISKCIMWFTSSVFSHSFVIMPDILDTPMCVEASEGGVDTARFDKNYLNDVNEGIQIWTLNIDQDIKDNALKTILHYLETGYGFLEYPWFMWRRLNKLFGKDIKAQNNWNHSGMICSQLCVTYLRACGLDYIFEGYGEGSIAPQDLQDIFKAHSDLFTVRATFRL